MTASSAMSVDTGIETASRLPDLLALAANPSSEGRRALLRELTESFFGASSLSEVESGLYGDVLANLADEMETEVRAELSTRFAEHAQAPTRLVRRLIHDEAPVADVMLRHSPVLRSADLLEVVRERGQDHLRAVSSRTDLTTAISDAIVQRGDDATLGILLRNETAPLSRGASEAAVDRAKINPDLHQAIVERSTLPPDLLNEMYFVVEARLRRRILDQNAHLDPAILETALSRGRDRLATSDGVLPADYSESLAYVGELQAADQLQPAVLARLLRSGSRTSFLIALGQLADIDFHTVRRIVDSRELDALAVVCKAANLDRALFLTYAVVILNDDSNAMGKAHSYAKLYAELTQDAALRTMRFWRLRRTADAT